MKFFRYIPIFLTLGTVPGAEPPAAVPGSTAPFPGNAGSAEETKLTPANPIKGPSWLGFKVTKPDDTTRAHLPELPQGVGFVIQSVEAKGPADLAGLQPMDIIWKFGDQLLVNEGQLAVLLRLKKPGDEVALSLFRGGREMEIALKVGAFPLNRPVPLGPAVDGTAEKISIARDQSPEARTATLSTDDGNATLKRLPDGLGYELSIRDGAGEVIFNGNLSSSGDTSPVPEAWRRRVSALRRGLDAALDGRFDHVRPPRQRIVSPSPVEQSEAR